MSRLEEEGICSTVYVTFSKKILKAVEGYEQHQLLFAVLLIFRPF